MVVTDEAHVALDPALGEFPTATTYGKVEARPFVDPCYGVLQFTTSILAGTNMSLGNGISTAVSEIADSPARVPFNDFPSLDVAEMKDLAKTYFGLELSKSELDDAAILKGRCRFFMLAMSNWLTSPSLTFADAIANVVQTQQTNDPTSVYHSISCFVERYQQNRGMLKRITDDLLTSFAEGKRTTLVYQPNTANTDTDCLAVNELVDTSMACTVRDGYDLTLDGKRIPYRVFYAVKHDGRHKSRLHQLLVEDESRLYPLSGQQARHVVLLGSCVRREVGFLATTKDRIFDLSCNNPVACNLGHRLSCSCSKSKHSNIPFNNQIILLSIHFNLSNPSIMQHLVRLPHHLLAVVLLLLAMVSSTASAASSPTNLPFSLGVRDSFMIAHSFHGNPKFGPAGRLHGATYTCDVEFSAQSLVEDTNWVIDIGLATELLKEVLNHYNFHNLDEVFPDKTLTTTKGGHETLNAADGAALGVVMEWLKKRV